MPGTGISTASPPMRSPTRTAIPEKNRRPTVLTNKGVPALMPCALERFGLRGIRPEAFPSSAADAED